MMNTTVKMTQLHSFMEQQLCSENVRQNANQVARARNDPYDNKVSSQMSKCSDTNPSCTWPIGIAPKRHQGKSTQNTVGSSESIRRRRSLKPAFDDFDDCDCTSSWA